MVTIYALECGATGMAYVGCTAGKPGKRMREHRCLLNKKRHTAERLQRDWERYGGNAFYLKILETLPANIPVSAKREAELRWMARYKVDSRLYNAHGNSFAPTLEAIAKGIEASRSAVGNRWSPEANLKRRLAQLGKPKGHGAKISAAKQAKAMR
jgi:hypothetical protein